MKFSAFGRLFAVLALAFFLTGTLSARPFLVIFGSELCDDCNELKNAWQEEMTEPDAPVLVYVCIDDDNAYAFLKKCESLLKAGDHPALFPVLLAGTKFYYGIDAIRENFDECLELAANTPEALSQAEFDGIRECAETTEGNYAVCTNIVAEEQSLQNASEDKTGASLVSKTSSRYSLLFLETSASCKHCERQNRELELLKKEIPELDVARYEVTEPIGQMMYMRFLKHFGIGESAENLAPLVAWNDGYVSGRLATSEELAAVLERQSEDGKEPFWFGGMTAAESAGLAKRNQNFLENATFWTSVVGGALDGINPCAFATAIFLVSYLLYLKKGRRFVLAVGLCFCLGVFLAYLLFGIGLSFLVDFLNRFSIVKKILYGVFALAGFVLAILHLRDALRFRKSGNAADMDMGLNVQTHRKIHDKIHTWGKLTGALAIPAAVVLGCVVSSMEFVCTGQIYLPMLVAINASGFNFHAFLLLLVYNLVFIVPLVAVTVLAYFGVGAQALAKWARDHVLLTKVLMAALFLSLAGLMVWMMWWSL